MQVEHTAENLHANLQKAALLDAGFAQNTTQDTASKPSQGLFSARLGAIVCCAQQAAQPSLFSELLHQAMASPQCGTRLLMQDTSSNGFTRRLQTLPEVR